MKSRFTAKPSVVASPAKPPLTAEEFVEAVLRTEPELAAFDCDGTLWDGDAGEGFFSWELANRVVSDEIAQAIRERYADYKSGNVSEDDMCGEMVTLHKGLFECDVRNLARKFFEENFVRRIFPEMVQLVHRLQEAGCEIWAVSSTNEWVIQAAMKYFDIPANNVLAAAVENNGGIITDRLIRVPSGPGKPRAIQEIVKRTPSAIFGNSKWDVDMLRLARNAYAVNPNPDLEEIARNEGWVIYFPKLISFAG